jgi:hypothetical protein
MTPPKKTQKPPRKKQPPKNPLNAISDAQKK